MSAILHHIARDPGLSSAVSQRFDSDRTLIGMPFPNTYDVAEASPGSTSGA